MDPKKSKTLWQEIAPFVFATTGWIVGPVILGLMIGDYLDNRYASAPKFLFVCVFGSFIMTMAGLVWETIKYNKAQNTTKK